MSTIKTLRFDISSNWDGTGVTRAREELNALKRDLDELDRKNPTITVDANTARANTQLDETQRKADHLDGDKVSINVVADNARANSSLDSTKAKADHLNATHVNINADANTTGAVNHLRELETKAKQTGATKVNINADAATAGAISKLNKLKEDANSLGRMHPTVNVNANTAGAMTHLREFEAKANALNHRDINVNVNANTLGANAHLDEFRRHANDSRGEARRLGDDALRTSGFLVRLGDDAARGGGGLLQLGGGAGNAAGGLTTLGGSAASAGSSVQGFGLALGIALLVAAAWVALAPLVAATAAAIPLAFMLAAGMLISTNKKLKDSFSDVLGVTLKQLLDDAMPLIKAMLKGLEELNSFLKATGPEIKAAFAAAAPLVQPFVQLITKFVQAILPGFTDAMHHMGPLISGLAEGFGKLGGAIGMMFDIMAKTPGLGAAISNIFGALGQVLVAFGQSIAQVVAADHGRLLVTLLQGLAKILLALTPGVIALAPAFIALVPAIVGAAKAIAVLMEILGPVATYTIKGLIIMFNAIRDGLTHLDQPIKDVGNFFKKMWDDLKKWTSEGGAALTTAWKATWNGLKTAAQTVWDWMKTAWKAVTDGLKTAWDTVSNGIKSGWNSTWNFLKSTAQTVWDWMKSTWKTVTDGIKSAWDTVSNGLKSAWQNTWNFLKSSAQTVWDWMKSTWQTVTNFFKTTWDTIGNGLKSAWQNTWNFMKTTATTIWNWMKSTWQTIVNGLKTAWDTVGNLIKTAWQNVWNFLKTTATTIWNGIKTEWQNFLNNVKQFWDTWSSNLKTVWEAVWNWLKDTAKKIWDLLKTGWKDFLDGLKLIWDTASDAIKKAWEATWNHLKSTASTLWGEITGVIKKAVDTIKGIINDLIGAWNTVAGAVGLPKIPSIGGGGGGGGGSNTSTLGPTGGGQAGGSFGGGQGGSSGTGPGGVPGFSRGGFFGGYHPGNDSILSYYSPGEGVLVPEAVAALGGEDFIHGANYHFSGGRAGMPGIGAKHFSEGGVYKFAQGGLPIPNPIGGLEGAAKAGISAVGDLVGGNVSKAGSDLAGAVGDLTGAFGLPDIAKVTAMFMKIITHARSLSGALLSPMGAKAGEYGMDMLNKIIKAIEAKIQAMMAAMAAAMGGGKGNPMSVAGLRNTVIAALQKAGMPVTEANIMKMLTRISIESSGNPNAINNWDINAQRGDPSEGLAQITLSNFAKYGSGNILNPLDNLVASLNYIKAVYGGNIPTGAAYASGTDNAMRGWALVGEEGPELINFGGGEKVMNNRDSMRHLSSVGERHHDGCGEQHFHIDARGASPEAIDKLNNEAIPQLRMMLTAGVGRKGK